MQTESYTRCPHCKATFKVTEEQLQIAKGRVRCGACMSIFDALAYILPNSNEAVSDTPTDQSTPAETQPTALENEATQVEQVIEQSDEAKDSDLFQDDPEEDSKAEHYEGGFGLSAELSTSFLELDEDNNSKDPYTTDIQEAEPDVNETDESWTQDILDDISEESDSRKEPTIPNEPEEDLPYEPVASEFEQTPQHDEKDSIQFYYAQDTSDKKRNWLISGFLIIFNIALLLVLLAQASWFHYEKLATYPQLAKAYQYACERIGCVLPELSDTSKIRSHSLVVRSHPSARNALVIDAVIINEAKFEQHFPNIALYFSDINNQTVAQRLIKPEEYLSSEALGWGKMPSQQPIHISLELVDPGKEAVNYSLKFFKGETKQATNEEQSSDQLSTKQSKI